VSLHCSALGKVFLAHGVATLPKGRLEQHTAHTLTTRPAVAADLALVKERGYAITSEELEPGLVAIAAPIRSEEGDVIAAISVSGPTIRLTPDRISSVAALLVAQTQSLSKELWYSRHTFQPPKEGIA